MSEQPVPDTLEPHSLTLSLIANLQVCSLWNPNKGTTGDKSECDVTPPPDSPLVRAGTPLSTCDGKRGCVKSPENTLSD